MKKRLLSVLLAMVMVLGMLPGEAWAEDTLEDETRNVMVSTLEELDAIENTGSTSVTIKSGANIFGTDGTSYTFASLTIEEGASLKVSWLNCHGSIVIKGTLETEYDIYCSGNFLLTGGGKLTIGRTLNMYKMNTSLLNLNGTVDYLNRDDMGGVSLWYDALDEFEFLDCLNKAANDTREEYKYWICNSSDLRDVSILLTRNAEIPANTTVSVDTGYQDNSSPGLDIAKGVELVNNGTIMTSSSFSSSSNIGIKGTLVNNGMLSINQSDTLNCSGEIVNNGSLLISGSINITGSLVNNASISVNRLNDSEKGVLTLADGASYSGRKDATISSTYRTGTYRDFITGFDWDLFEIYESDSDLEGVHHVQLSNKRDIEGSEPEGPDTSTDIKLVACSPTVGEEIPYRASSLELKLTFDHEIEGFDFSEGTLHIYEAETGREVYAVRRNGQAADPNRPNGDVSLSYPASNTMTIKTISNNLDLNQKTKYYVTLDYGFLRFKETSQSYGIRGADTWWFKNGDKYPFSWNDSLSPIDAVKDNDNLVMAMTALAKLGYSTFGPENYEKTKKTIAEFVAEQKNMEWKNDGGNDIWVVNGQSLGSYDGFYTDVVGDYTVYDVLDDNKTSGFYGVCFQSPDGKYIISYRGSQNMDVVKVIKHLLKNDEYGYDDDWVTDADFVLRNVLSDQFKYALQFYKDIARDVGKDNIVLTGHSLGGALAAYVSICTGARAYPIDGAVGHIVDTTFWQSFADIHAFQGVDNFNFVNLTDEKGVTWLGDWIQATKLNYYPMVTYRSLHPQDSTDLDDSFKKIAGSHHQLSYLNYVPPGWDYYEMGDMVQIYDCNARWSHDILDYTVVLKTAAIGALVGALVAGPMGGVTGGGIVLAGNWIFNRGRVQLGTTGDDTIKAPSKAVDRFVSNHQFGGSGSDHLVGYAASDILVSGPSGYDRLEGQGGNDTYIIDSDCRYTVIFDCSGIDIILLRGWNKDSITAPYDPQDPNVILITDGSRSIGVSRYRQLFSPIIVAWVNEDCSQSKVIYEDLIKDVKKSRMAAAPAGIDAQSDGTVSQEATRLVLVEGTAELKVYDENKNLLKTEGSFSNETTNTQHTDYAYYYGYSAADGEEAYALLYLFNDGCTVQVESSGTVSASVCQYDSGESFLIDEQRAEKIDLSNAELALVSAGEDEGFYLLQPDAPATPLENVVQTLYAQTVTMSQDNLSLKVGATAQLTVTVFPAEAGTDGDWISSNPTVAKVDENGVVTACGEGVAEIVFFSANGVSSSCSVSVTSTVSSGGNSSSHYPTSSVGTKPNKPDTPESSTLPFTDVTTTGWYYDAVRFVYEKGIMNGIGNNLFAPNANLSRAQLAQILYNKEGRPAVNGVSSFTDVAAGAWYSDAVIWAAEKNIVGGYGNGLFGPDDNITREQLAVMLWRYAGEPASSFDLTFSDADKISDFALPAIRWAVENGILNGKGNNILDPKGFATRAEVAQMFKNYLG